MSASPKARMIASPLSGLFWASEEFWVSEKGLAPDESRNLAGTWPEPTPALVASQSRSRRISWPGEAARSELGLQVP